MAKAELDILLNKLQGRLTGHSEFYVTNRHGKTVISNYPLHKNKKKLANKNLNRANRRFFGDNSTAATQDKFYSTLRGFIIAQLRKEA